MLTYGYILDTRENDMGGREFQVRIPSVHGAYRKSEYKGKTPRNYVEDDDLPWYVVLTSVGEPLTGEVAVLAAINSSNNQFVVLGTTGSVYEPGDDS